MLNSAIMQKTMDSEEKIAQILKWAFDLANDDQEENIETSIAELKEWLKEKFTQQDVNQDE